MKSFFIRSLGVCSKIKNCSPLCRLYKLFQSADPLNQLQAPLSFDGNSGHYLSDALRNIQQIKLKLKYNSYFVVMDRVHSTTIWRSVGCPKIRMNQHK